jgi:hypothetical protein
MHQLELPVPELQVPLFDAHGLMGYPDFLFAEQRVIAEADGLLKYAQDGALAREKQREDRFRTPATRCSGSPGTSPSGRPAVWSSARCGPSPRPRAAPAAPPDRPRPPLVCRQQHHPGR